jgi:hypothetical protein
MFPKFTIKIPAITVDFYPSISNFMQGIWCDSNNVNKAGGGGT